MLEPKGLLQGQPQQRQGQPQQAQQGPPQQPQQGQPQQERPQRNPAQRDYNVEPLGDRDEKQLRALKVNALKLIHSDKTRERILSAFDKADDHPINKISRISTSILNRIEGQARKDGDSIDNAVKIYGGNLIVGEVINLAEAAGKIKPMNDDEKTVALSKAVQDYTNQMIRDGEITREELKKYTNQSLSIAEQSGQLDMTKINRRKQEAGVSPKRPEKQVQRPAQGQAPQVQAPQVQAPVQPQKVNDPFNPSTTMSEQLNRRGGLLNG